MEKQDQFEAFQSKCTVNINGVITPPEQATISIFDRGFLYGDSIYEVTYTEDNCLIFFHDHLERLYNSASLLGMSLFLSRDEIVSESLKTLEASKLSRAYIRIIITRGETEIGLDPTNSFKNNLVIIVKPQPKYPPIQYENGIKIFLSNVVRNNRKALDPNAKSGNYLNNVLAIKEAKNQGFDDAIMLNNSGMITEGTTFNIWAVKNNIVYTPPVSSGLLRGITREKTIEICNDFSITLDQSEFDAEFLFNADEVFITSSTKGIMPVCQIGEKKFGNSIADWPMTKMLLTKYADIIDKEKNISEYKYT